MTTIDIAAALKKLRTERNISQPELAHMIDVNQSLIANIEAGRKVPSLAITVKLADALFVSIDTLVGRKVG